MTANCDFELVPDGVTVSCEDGEYVITDCKGNTEYCDTRTDVALTLDRMLAMWDGEDDYSA